MKCNSQLYIVQLFTLLVDSIVPRRNRGTKRKRQRKLNLFRDPTLTGVEIILFGFFPLPIFVRHNQPNRFLYCIILCQQPTIEFAVDLLFYWQTSLLTEKKKRIN